ncbi:MAG: hypothetical protein K8Q92_04055 [Methylophilales bacterium]|nr:hypothetical protein [Methylophilales bacterium]
MDVSLTFWIAGLAIVGGYINPLRTYTKRTLHKQLFFNDFYFIFSCLIFACHQAQSLMNFYRATRPKAHAI